MDYPFGISSTEVIEYQVLYRMNLVFPKATYLKLCWWKHLIYLNLWKLGIYSIWEEHKDQTCGLIYHLYDKSEEYTHSWVFENYIMTVCDRISAISFAEAIGTVKTPGEIIEDLIEKVPDNLKPEVFIFFGWLGRYWWAVLVVILFFLFFPFRLRA